MYRAAYVVARCGNGLAGRDRRGATAAATGQATPLENGLDVFHTTQEARRVLRQIWSHVERLWEQAEAADRRVAQAQRQGRDARGVAVAAPSAWKKAAAAFQQYERVRSGLGRSLTRRCKCFVPRVG